MERLSLQKFNQFRSSVHKALKSWKDSYKEPDETLIRLQLVKSELQGRPYNHSNLRLVVNTVLLEHINLLQQNQLDSYSILKMRFVDNLTTLEVANKTNLLDRTVKHQQRELISKLTQSILDSEWLLREQEIQAVENRLAPPNYTKLFGVEKTQELLTQKLLDPQAPWILSISGLGGIGKTSLADSVVRKVIHYFHFDQIIWFTVSGRSSIPQRNTLTTVTPETFLSKLAHHFSLDLSESADGEQLTLHLRSFLKQRPYLIVVDNLEIEEDASEFMHLFSDFVSPSKFLFTSRIPLYMENGVFNCQLLDLSFEDAMSLIKEEAAYKQIPLLVEIDEALGKSIYDQVGGNPLALKLIVSLASTFSISDIIDDMQRGVSQNAENLYIHIYQKAWDTLSDEAQKLLSVMPLVGTSGGTLTHLMAISQLERAKTMKGINELASRSLLEIHGSINERRYSIHQLTETFLSSNVNGWQDL